MTWQPLPMNTFLEKIGNWNVFLAESKKYIFDILRLFILSWNVNV
jgi:hypothetical protein